MQTLDKKLQELQKKPYQARVRILWTAVAAAALILLGIWMLTLRARTSRQTEQGPESFSKILENIKRIKDIKF